MPNNKAKLICNLMLNS